MKSIPAARSDSSNDKDNQRDDDYRSNDPVSKHFDPPFLFPRIVRQQSNGQPPQSLLCGTVESFIFDPGAAPIPLAALNSSR
jgi:hypothetical protein